jgi:hypothetical protein
MSAIKESSGQTIKFHYLPQAHTTWAISASSDPALNALAAKDMSSWPRASGPVVDNDGAGKTAIKHPRTGERIQFDWTNVSEPRR